MQKSGVHLVLDRGPFNDESLTGLLIRIAGANLLQSVGSLERLADIAVPRIALEDGGLEQLARLSGLSDDVLRWRQYRRSGSGILRLFFGHEIHPFRLQTTAFRYCPVCMGQMGYHKAIWELDLIQSCPTHRQPLITSDPETGRTLSWRRKDLLEASVGDLPTADGYQEAPSDEDEALRGQELIYEFLGFGDYGRMKNIAGLGAELTFDQLAQLILFLGGEFNNAGVATGTKRGPRDPQAMLQITAIGYDVLCDWPNAFYLRLDQLRREYDGARLGLSRVFDSIFRRMSKMDDGSAKTILQRAITEFLLDKPIPFNPKNVHFVRGHEGVERRYVTLKQATEMLGVTQYRGRQIALSEGWIDPDKTDRHTPNMIPKRLVQEYEVAPRQYYTKKELFHVLGITRSAYPSLVKSGLITPVTDAVDGRTAYVFRKAEVDSLLDRVIATAPMVSSDQSKGEDLDLLRVLARLGPPSVSVGRLLTLVLAGIVEIDRYDPQKGGIYGLHVDERRIPEVRRKVSKIGSFSVLGEMVLKRICLDREWLEAGVQQRRIRVVEVGTDFNRSRLHLGDVLSYIENPR